MNTPNSPNCLIDMFMNICSFFAVLYNHWILICFLKHLKGLVSTRYLDECIPVTLTSWRPVMLFCVWNSLSVGGRLARGLSPPSCLQFFDCTSSLCSISPFISSVPYPLFSKVPISPLASCHIQPAASSTFSLPLPRGSLAYYRSFICRSCR